MKPRCVINTYTKRQNGKSTATKQGESDNRHTARGGHLRQGRPVAADPKIYRSLEGTSRADRSTTTTLQLCQQSTMSSQKELQCRNQRKQHR